MLLLIVGGAIVAIPVLIQWHGMGPGISHGDETFPFLLRKLNN